MEADESGDTDKMAMFADALPTELFRFGLVCAGKHASRLKMLFFRNRRS